MIIKTRQGGKNYPCLYAITWQPIDECRGKNLELGPTTTAPRKFSLELNMTKAKTESLGQKLYQLNTETVLVEGIYGVLAIQKLYSLIYSHTYSY
jgi:hypothetical protein